jgi:hypothetical protein
MKRYRPRKAQIDANRRDKLGQWLVRFLNDDCTSGILCDTTRGFPAAASLLNVSNYDSDKDLFVSTLKQLPNGTKLWKAKEFGFPTNMPYAENEAFIHSWLELSNVRSAIDGVLRNIHANDAKQPLLGLNDNGHLYHIGKLLPLITVTGLTASSGTISTSKQLVVETVNGIDSFHVHALPATIFAELLALNGWKYLKRCAYCDQYSMASRTDAVTCTSLCRKKRNLQNI